MIFGLNVTVLARIKYFQFSIFKMELRRSNSPQFLHCTYTVKKMTRFNDGIQENASRSQDFSILFDVHDILSNIFYTHIHIYRFMLCMRSEIISIEIFINMLLNYTNELRKGKK